MTKDPEILPSLSEALAEWDPHPVLHEAQRQYEALLHMRRPCRDIHVASQALSNPTPDHRFQLSVTTQVPPPINLAQHYRNLYVSATEDLSTQESHILLTICFAYKTKSRVLRFLDLLDVSDIPWVLPIRDVVRKFGRDTCFPNLAATHPDVDDENQDPSPRSTAPQVGGKCTAQLAPGPIMGGINLPTLKDIVPAASVNSAPLAAPYSLRSRSTADAITIATRAHIVIGPPGPYFVISTLPLAFPGQFFAAFATHAPIQHLAVSSILSYPPAALLALSQPLKSGLRSNNVPRLWARTPEVSSASWYTLFDHLLEGRARLLTEAGLEWEIEKSVAEEGDERGIVYEKTDLQLWVAEWTAKRQKGMARGLRLSSSAAKAEVWSEVAGGDSGEAATGADPAQDINDDDGDGDADDNMGRKQKPGVSWNEERLEEVQEIPRRSTRKKKQRRDHHGHYLTGE